MLVVVNANEVVVACYKHVFRVVWNASSKTVSPPPNPNWKSATPTCIAAIVTCSVNPFGPKKLHAMEFYILVTKIISFYA
jgi:hypothetical protein